MRVWQRNVPIGPSRAIISNRLFILWWRKIIIGGLVVANERLCRSRSRDGHGVDRHDSKIIADGNLPSQECNSREEHQHRYQIAVRCEFDDWVKFVRPNRLSIVPCNCATLQIQVQRYQLWIAHSYKTDNSKIKHLCYTQNDITFFLFFISTHACNLTIIPHRMSIYWNNRRNSLQLWHITTHSLYKWKITQYFNWSCKNKSNITYHTQ